MRKAVKLRHEQKFQISKQEDYLLTQRLKHLFQHDGHAKADGTYQVNSLYFDTPYDDALVEKISGVNKREKFRIRYYEQDTSFLRVEKKYKINGLCGKRSTRITPEQVENLLNGVYGFLLESGDDLLIELYSKIQGKGLRPKTIVSYDREAFLYAPGNVRVTLDRNVRTSFNCKEFLNLFRFQMGTLDERTVLEVKYDEFLPEIVRMAVQVPGQRPSGCSKYAVCRRYD